MFWQIAAIIAGMVLFGKATANSAYEKREEERRLEEKRKNTPFYFNQGLSKDEFEEIVYKTAKPIKRITNITIDGPIAYFTVRAQSGISEWKFRIDFNDFGRFTGKYWVTRDNYDSSIPENVASRIAEESLAIIEKRIGATQQVKSYAVSSQEAYPIYDSNDNVFISEDKQTNETGKEQNNQSKGHGCLGCLVSLLLIVVMIYLIIVVIDF